MESFLKYRDCSREYVAPFDSGECCPGRRTNGHGGHDGSLGVDGFELGCCSQARGSNIGGSAVSTATGMAAAIVMTIISGDDRGTVMRALRGGAHSGAM